jgi:alpha-methylacyl-CoA racemase
MAGHDIDYLAVTGVLHAIGRAGGPPQPPMNLLGDFGGGGMYLLVGVLAALLERQTTGRGQVVDAAIVDGATSLAAMIYGMRSSGDWHDGRGANLLDTGAPFYDVYETADGQWMAVGALEPQFFAELLRLLDLEHVPPQHDRQQWPALRAMLQERFCLRTRDEWCAVFDGTDACVTPVLSWEEAALHPHLSERGTVVIRDGVVQPAPAPRFSQSTTRLPSPPPRPGQHSEEILREWKVRAADELLVSGAVTKEGPRA